MAYKFKKLEEVSWAVLVVVVMFAAQVLIEFDLEVIDDWETWAKALGAGAVRAAAGAVLAFRSA